MPQLTVRGIPSSLMAAISLPLVEELAILCECGTDNFTVDCIETASVMGGKRVDTFPFIEVAWFDRGRDVRDRFAEAISRHARLAGVAELEIAFKVYQPDAYYINGKSCSVD
ncbi:DUF1904 family protein [Paenibacillus tarimensis]|uniref:DUF1904 family protein n=1 Tax=Paenibacillus tarimensis TaxID=416012 RepID=UPI001F2A2C13|nr:DUF1904 family protein [Paenibacillus tarimensis]MCF2946268.1 DUF1904 domain-containing protein [Paenibacillus tarimensis]